MPVREAMSVSFCTLNKQEATKKAPYLLIANVTFKQGCHSTRSKCEDINSILCRHEIGIEQL